MELACVVSPVESYEDINNVSSVNQNQDKNPSTNLGKIIDNIRRETLAGY